jgi:ornithine cyclodeaminase/alanine dehydrogenase
VAPRRLARPESTTLGILGCGVQGRTNTEALKVLFPLQRVMAYDISPQAVENFAADISQNFDLEVVPVDTPQKAVTGCDLVVTAGPILKTPHAAIRAGWLDEGAFASLVDFDSYWHPLAMKEVDKFCTDDIPQLLHYREAGYFQDIPPIYADLGDLVAGKKPGRESAGERTMTCNLGLAMDDMAVAPTIYQEAVQKGLGTWLPM